MGPHLHLVNRPQVSEGSRMNAQRGEPVKYCFLRRAGILALCVLVANLAHADQHQGSQDTTGLMREAAEAFQAGDLDSAKSLFQLVLVADPKNQAAQKFLGQIATREARSAVLVRTLEKIIIPQLELRDASAREAFEYTLALAKKSAPAGFHANLVWIVPPDHPERVTLSLISIPAKAALEYVAQSAGLRLVFDEHAITVRKPEPPSKSE